MRSTAGYVSVLQHRADQAAIRAAAEAQARRRAEVIANCPICQKGKPGPSHFGSSLCGSGSLASGGHRDHCSCDYCY